MPALRLLTAALGVACASVQAAELAWTDRPDGASCQFLDAGLGLPWPEIQASRGGTQGGANAGGYANHRIEAGDLARVRRIDVTRLIQGWWKSSPPQPGLLIRHLSGNPVSFSSREFADSALRPTLSLKWADGRRKLLEAAADVALDCSTHQALGAMDTLLLAGHSSLALRFNLKVDPGQAAPVEAQLWLTRTPQGLGAASSLEVLPIRLGAGDATAPRPGGLASQFPKDQGLERHPDVLFVDRFDGGRLAKAWLASKDSNVKIVDDDPAHAFEALDGPALRITIDKGAQLGSDLRYRFRQHHGSEPDDIYFRYCLRLAKTWAGAVEGGKLPGLAGTYGQAGWGGRGWDGQKGWSLRGSFGLPTNASHPVPSHIMLGTYAYHGGSGSTYGEVLPWTGSGAAGVVALNRWWCIEQHVKMNTPGRSDGVLEVWIDGRPVLSRSDLRLRDLPTLHIEEAWLDIFHGGMKTAASAMHAYVDNVVIARSYIGPVRH